MTEHVIYILSGPSNTSPSSAFPSNISMGRGPVFIGVTHDLATCLRRHRSGKVTRPEFRLDRLVYTERFACSFKADARHRALKAASCEWLYALISSQNPTWQDLAAAPIQRPKAA